ncbi:MAG: polysaccharide biosynthesis protein, partial [Treponema sp.]|nr:polysaccharide biosynthesis protein [Treponema sp.]
PQKTEYEKILILKNLEMNDDELTNLLEKLEPICFFDKKNDEHFRNKEELISILRNAVPSLDEFYEMTKDKAQAKRIANSSEKITL